jgi:hypothetical protein
MKPWASHFRPATPQDLHEVRDAARELADQAGHPPGRPGTVFQKVASLALVTTAVLSGGLAAVHLWRNLCPRHKEKDHRPEPPHRAAPSSAHEHGHVR